MKEKSKSKKNPFEGIKPRRRRHKVTMAETALKLLMFYTVLNSGYKRGKLMVIRGDVSGKAKLVVNDPEDTGIDDIDPSGDMDPVLFFYLGNNNKLRVVVCNIDTPLPSPSDVTPAGDPANPLTSTGRYTIYARSRTLARSIKAAMRAARQAGGKTGGGADDELEDK